MGKIKLNDLQTMEKEAVEVLQDIRRRTVKNHPWHVVGQIAWLVFYMIGFTLMFGIAGVMTGWWESNDFTGPIVSWYLIKIFERFGR